MLISQQHKFNSSLHYSPVVRTPPYKQNGDSSPWQQSVTLISFNDHWQPHAFDRYQIVSKVWLSNFSISDSTRGYSHLPEGVGGGGRGNNYKIAALLRQQSKVLREYKIDAVYWVPWEWLWFTFCIICVCPAQPPGRRGCFLFPFMADVGDI